MLKVLYRNSTGRHFITLMEVVIGMKALIFFFWNNIFTVTKHHLFSMSANKLER